MSKNSVRCQLWMGRIEPYMTESFIIKAFQNVGENPLSVKVMRNRHGELCGYCFVGFQYDDEAIRAKTKLNGTFIPNSCPPCRFYLNSATNTKVALSDKEFSLWVGDLSPDVDDYQLYKTFASRYESVKGAKVTIDSSGQRKGLVRFSSEEDQKHCLTTMNGFKGLGSKALKISNALKSPASADSNGGYTATQDYSQFYDVDNYWQNYAAWQVYYHNPSSNPTLNYSLQSSVQQVPEETVAVEDDDLELVDHTTSCDIEAWNREVMERDYNLWDALECSKWLPLETYG